MLTFYTVFNSTGEKTITALVKPKRKSSETSSARIMVVNPLPTLTLEKTSFTLGVMSTLALKPDPVGKF